MQSPVIRNVLVAVLLSTAAPCAIVLLASTYLFTHGFVQEQLHESLELTGFCIALGTAMLLVMRLREGAAGVHLIWPAIALTAMGLMEATHALVPQGGGSTWMRLSAALVGGMLYGAVWLTPSHSAVKNARSYVIATAILALGMSIALWNGRDSLPEPVAGNGDFFFPAILASLGASAGFASAALYFIRRYILSQDREDLTFTAQTLLFATASLLLIQADVWSAEWWVSHVVRLCAYGISLVAAYYTLLSLYKNSALHSQELESVVEARTKELVLTNEALHREVQERERVEREQRYLAHIVNSADDAIIGSSADGTITSWNPAAERMLGYRPDEVIGKSVLLLIPPDRHAEEEIIFERIRKGARVTHLETVRLRKDGSTLEVSLTVSPIVDSDGTIIGASKILHDITERRQAESQIRELNIALERRVAERTAELVAANEELAGFSYAVSHDLRAPLRAMSGFAQALVEDYGDSLTGEARVYLDQITKASEHMAQLIDGLLVLSRSTRGELRRDPIDLSALCENLRQELERSDPDRTIAWQVEPNMTAIGDPRMVEVLMRNLLANAWKYTGHTTEPAIRVFTKQEKGALQYCVADNGAGFEMQHLDRLFKPFQRLHRQDEFPGIGIGLATAQRIVHRHGGEIEAVAARGAGATFAFTLPLLEERRSVSR